MSELFHRDHRIDQNHQVGSGTHSVDLIRRKEMTKIEMSSNRRGHMAAGRKPQNADALLVDAPFGRARPHSANGSRRIQQRRGMMVAWAKTIFEYERDDAERVEPFSNRSPFVIGKMAITTSRTYDHGRAGCFVFRW